MYIDFNTYLGGNVSRLQPPVLPQHLGGLLEVVEVAHHDVAALHAQFTVGGDLAPEPREFLEFTIDCLYLPKLKETSISYLANGAELLVLVGGGQLRPRALAHAVDLEDPDVETHEVLERLPGKGMVCSEHFCETIIKLHTPVGSSLDAVATVRLPGHHSYALPVFYNSPFSKCNLSSNQYITWQLCRIIVCSATLKHWGNTY